MMQMDEITARLAALPAGHYLQVHNGEDGFRCEEVTPPDLFARDHEPYTFRPFQQ
jgi:hypothetical protein